MIKIALYQMNIAWEDKERNYLNVENRLKEVYKNKIDLFLLPEMSFTGFSMNTDKTKEIDFETMNRMKIFARQYHMAIGFGWVKNCGEKSENHYTVIDKESKVISDYVKIHPFSFAREDQKFRGGDRIVFFKLKDVWFSTFICYDLRFPEIFQAASKKASVIIVPANWPEKRNEHWRCLLRARAIENQVYIIAVNCVGEIGGSNYSGDSCVVNPNGDIMQRSVEQEEVIVYELIDDVECYRKNFPVKEDRKEDLYYKYSDLLSESI